MPNFFYTARDKNGRIDRGSIEAVSRDELISTLQVQGLFVVSISSQEELKEEKRVKRKFHRRVKTDDLILFSRQLATMLNAGVTLLKSLEILSKQIESHQLYLAVKEVKRDIEGGSTLRDALDKYPKVFSKFWVNLVETGEASGHLPTVLDQLAQYLEASGSLRRKTVSAMIYPVLLICIATVAMFVFMVKIIPIFAEIFDSFEVQLPMLTKMVIGFSNILRHYLIYVLFILIAGGYTFYRYIHTERGKWMFDRFKFRLPIFGQFLQKLAIQRFSSGLSTLIESGVPILYSLEIIAKTSGDKVVEEALEDVKNNVREGKTMAEQLAKNQLFEPMVVQMVSVGEEIGELGKMLERIAFFYEERINTFVSRLTVLIEPFVLVFMGLVVGTLVIAMFLPIFSLASIAKG